MASRESEAVKDMYRSWQRRLAENPEMDLETLRDMFETWHRLTAEPEQVTYAEVNAGGVPAIWCIPEGCAENRVITWTHGGGYVGGSMHSHRKLAGHVARAVGCRALVIDFRRAPENPHPGPVQDAVAAYRWLVNSGTRPEHIACAGDSGGGGLCTAMVLKLRDDGDALPAALMPVSPFYDMEAKGESLESRAETDIMIRQPILLQMAAMLLGEHGCAIDPLANPLYADPTGLPPVLLQVGDDEGLLSDSTRFAENCREAGVDVTIEIEPEMQHVYQMMAGKAPEADAAISRMATWVRPKLGLA